MADGVGMAAASGAGAGAVKGASIGAVLGSVVPGVGNVVGGAVGATAGAIIGGINSGAKRNQANKAMDAIQQEDPEERALQRFFARRKRAYMTGTADNLDRAGLRQGFKGGITNAFKYGATVRGLNQLSQMYQQGVSGLNAQGIQGALQYGSQETALTTDIAQRRLEVSLLRFSQKSAEAAQQTTEDKQNTGVGLMKVFDEMGKSGATMKAPSAPTTTSSTSDTGLKQVMTPSGDPFLGSGGTNTYSF